MRIRSKRSVSPVSSQFPDTAQDAAVKVIVPDVPPVIVTSDTETADADAVRIPALPTLSVPPVSARPAVIKAVVDDESEIVAAPDHRNPRVDIENVCADTDDDWNVMPLNSATERLDPANVMVPPVEESNVIVEDPADHDTDVDEFAHVPSTVHDSEPNEK